jgi:hypothetical protein
VAVNSTLLLFFGILLMAIFPRGLQTIHVSSGSQFHPVIVFWNFVNGDFSSMQFARNAGTIIWALDSIPVNKFGICVLKHCVVFAD